MRFVWARARLPPTVQDFKQVRVRARVRVSVRVRVRVRVRVGVMCAAEYRKTSVLPTAAM